jgi:signal peptidase II
MARSGRVLRFLCLVVLAVGLFGCDHATKIAAKATLESGGPIPIAPSVLHGAVELRYAANDDVAFSIFHRLGHPPSAMLLVVLSGLASIGILVMAVARARLRRRVEADGRPSEPPSAEERATQAGLALVIGGALGNVVDRLFRGYVVDFIHVKGWPIFNVADIAVVVGVALMVLARLYRHRRGPHRSGA